MNIDGAKILVTGGCGLIGSTTIDQLLREDVAQIVIYDNLVRGSMHNVAEIMNDKRVAAMMNPKSAGFDGKRLIYGVFKTFIDL